MKTDFSALSIKGISKIGDIVIPGDRELPSFSETNFIHEFGRISSYMTIEDKEGLKLLTSIFAFTPKTIIKLILKIASYHYLLPFWPAPILRQINLGLRGIIFTMYYSGIDDKDGHSRILTHLNYKSTINSKVIEDTEMEQLFQQANPILRSSTTTQEIEIEKIKLKANSAQKEISSLSLDERLKFITSLRKVILKNQERIIDKIQEETFKSRTDILISEIFPLLEHIEFIEHNGKKALRKENMPTPISMMGKKSQVWYESLGTILVISPWNYPFYQAIVPITCSFFAGNATLYKASELTPLRGLVESVLEESGFKKDWVQLFYGDGKLGSQLIELRPQKIFFTGSVETGKKIMQQASQYLIPVELELGGKDPMIVFEDVDLLRAVKGAVWGAFTNSGQSCTSVERLYIHEKIYDQFKSLLIQETEKIKFGVDADMGEMISEKQVSIVAELVRDAINQGAKILTGQTWDYKNKMIPPIIIEQSTHQLRINKEEIFGPVLPIFKFKNEDEVIKLANDSEFGLSASVWSADKERAQRVSSKIMTGNISINNVMVSEGNHNLPFGGTKNSGIGRYKGIPGLRGFCHIKSVLIDSNSKKIEANWYPYSSEKYRLFSSLTQALFSYGIKKWIGLIFFGLPLENLAQKKQEKP